MCFEDGQTGTKEHLQKPLSAAHAHRHQTPHSLPQKNEFSLWVKQLQSKVTHGRRELRLRNLT